MTIFTNNLKMIFGKKSNIFFMLILPILTIFYITALSTQEAKYNIVLIDQDQTQFTKQYKELISGDCAIAEYTNIDEVKNMILDRKADVAVIFKKGFTDELIKGEDVAVENIVLDGTNQNEPFQVNLSSFMASVKSIAKVSADEKEFYEGLDKFIEQKYVVEYKHFTDSYIEDAENAATALGYLGSCILFFIMISTALIMDERQSGVTNRISITPIRAASYYFQHFITYFFITVLQAVSTILLLPCMTELSFGETTGQVASVVLVACTFGAVCVSIGLFVNCVSPNSFASGSLTTLIELPLLMLGGCLWPKEIMPDFLQTIGKGLPTTWYMDATDSLVNGGTLVDNLFEVVGMCAFAVVLFVLTMVIKRKRIAFV